MKILVAATQAGSCNALTSPIKELRKRGHDVTAYATGSEAEARAFQDIEHQRISLGAQEDYVRLVQGYDVIMTGLHSPHSPEGTFIRAAYQEHIPAVGVQDQNSNYRLRLGDCIEDLPTIIAVMVKECVHTMKSELPVDMALEAVARARVVGWTALDHYAGLRESSTPHTRENLLQELSLNPEKSHYLFLSQNISPHSKYMENFDLLYSKKEEIFQYELQVCRAAFQAAADVGVQLLVKPHPGEAYRIDYTKEMAEHYDFTYIPAGACSTQQLMLAAAGVIAGRSSGLTEACLLDRNTAAILPDEIGRAWRKASPVISLDAIPYTLTWEGIPELMATVTSPTDEVRQALTKKRKKFSVDGKASQRLADLVEEIGR